MGYQLYFHCNIFLPLCCFSSLIYTEIKTNQTKSIFAINLFVSLQFSCVCILDKSRYLISSLHSFVSECSTANLNVTNGQYNIQDAVVDVGGEITACCNDGFLREGPETLTCLNTGQFSEPRPTCVGKKTDQQTSNQTDRQANRTIQKISLYNYVSWCVSSHCFCNFSCYILNDNMHKKIVALISRGYTPWNYLSRWLLT